MFTAGAPGRSDKLAWALHSHQSKMNELRIIDASKIEVCQPDTSLPPEYSDDAVAAIFVEQHHDHLRYVHPWGQWLHWDGKRWAKEETLLIYDLARRICRDVATRCNEPRLRRAIASAKTVNAVASLARADRRIAATSDQWDLDPYLLNTPAGIIDLRTGGIRNHDRLAYLTKITAVAAHGDCPRFLAFLGRITGGDRDLQDFLQRMLGYALTGLTYEHAFFFCYGAGANGKSVLLNTAMNIMGDHACAVPIETFTASSFDRHPTELAVMRGARLVVANETEQGRQWAEARIKQLTGGDRIAARFMRQDFFWFYPVFKLIVAGNHKPVLNSVDEAIRRRLHLIPFKVTIPEGERDPDLAEKLRAEYPGILAWMLAGCVAWFENGLQPPEAVMAATEEYLAQQDNISAWLDERCTIDEDGRETATTLFTSYTAWAFAAGVPAGKRNAFLDALRKQGFEDHHTEIGTTFFGIKIIPVMTGHTWADR